MAVIEVRDLRRSYRSRTGIRRTSVRDVEAVRGINFAVEKGELFGSLGPNGAGKTTTIKILITLLLPTSGTAVVLGHDVVRETRAVRRRVGYVADAGDEFRRLGNTRGEHAALISLGAALRRGGQPAQAIAACQQALEMPTNDSLPAYESDALIEITEARLALGQPHAAVHDGAAAVELTRRIGYRENEALALDALGRAQLTAGNVAQATTLWRDALMILRELGLKDEANAVANRLQPHGPNRSLRHQMAPRARPRPESISSSDQLGP